MLKSLTLRAAVAIAALATPVLAQDTTAELPEVPLMDLGEPVDTGPKLGQEYQKETFGDWQLRCVKTNAETDPCSLVQTLVDEQGGPVAEVSLFRIKDAQAGQAVAGVTLIAPLGTLLPSGVTVSVDGAPGKRYNFTLCQPQGCVAQIGMTDGDVAAFKGGETASVSLRPAQSRKQIVNLALSLKGFTAGYEAVDQVEQ